MADTTAHGTHITLAGENNARTLLFLHGGSFNRGMWLPQLAAFEDDYRVVAVDLPGHGALKDLPFTLDAAVEVAANALGSPDAGPALVVGLSLGGYVAMSLAASHGDRVAGLVLSGCSVEYRGALAALARVNLAAMRFVSRSRFERIQTRRVGAQFPEETAATMIAIGFGARGAADGLREIIGVDFGEALAGYSGPSLILNGERDGLSLRGEKRLARFAGDARVDTVPEAGHLCCLDKPSAYNTRVRQFADHVFGADA